MIIAISSFLIFIALVTIVLIINTTKLKAVNTLLTERIASLEHENIMLSEDKITSIKACEKYLATIEGQQKIIDNFEKMREESQKSTKAALFDLGNELSKQLIEIHKKENKESRETSEKHIKETSEKFNSEFERIVNLIGMLSKDIEQSKSTVDLIKNSLLSPSGAGNLAEITLENILKNSGLRDGSDFIMQYSVIGSDHNKLRPDAVIFLPGDNIMVVDAKTSKFLVNQDNDLDSLNKSMNIHLKSLSSKEYAESVLEARSNKEKNSNVITLMFLPTEHALEKIINADREFMTKAWKLNIFPVGPAGLMNMLTYAKFQITEQLMFENHQKIIAEVKKLLSSVVILAEHSAKLGSNIQSIVSSYDKFAASFNGNFLAKAKSINKLGIDAGNKLGQTHLTRYQLISTKSDLIEVEQVLAEESNIKQIES